MRGTIMDVPLLLSRLISYAADNHSNTEIVGRRISGAIERFTYAQMESRAKRLAKSLSARGFGVDACIGSLAWNTCDHIELFYGTLGIGIGLHTINPRLSVEHLAYMINKVGDQMMFFDSGTVGVVQAVRDLVPCVRTWVFMGDEEEVHGCGMPEVLTKSELVTGFDDEIQWPQFDERQAATICFTSGTTGMPKGVAYSHRSIMLGAADMSMADMFGCYRSGDLEVMMPIAPIFHANGWQMPFTAPMNGCKLVLPGKAFDAENVVQLLQQEAVTLAGGVPTVWRDIIDYLDRHKIRLPSLRTGLIAGTRVPSQLFDDFERHDIRTHQVWGMTEAPGVTRGTPPPGSSQWSVEGQRDIRRQRQGRMAYLTELRILDDAGHRLPNDGGATGRLFVRGPTVTGNYVGDSANTIVDWLDTGDIACIHPDGTIQIVDRAKDVIKSGGEWISTQALEAAASSHAAVQYAAAIAVPHEKWQERPLMLCVLRPGKHVSADELRKHIAAHVPKWWLPEEIVFIDAMPLTATGKINKIELRQLFAGSHRQMAS